MGRKICTDCNINKMEDFYNKYTECKICNIKRRLKRYFGNRDKTIKSTKVIL